MSEFTEKFTSWDEVIFPIEASFKASPKIKDWLVVKFDSKSGSGLSGTVVARAGSDSYPPGYYSSTWNNTITSWTFKQQTYKYDPDQTGDTEEDI